MRREILVRLQSVCIFSRQTINRACWINNGEFYSLIFNKSLIFFIVIATASKLFAMDPYVKTDIKDIEIDGTNYVQTDRQIYFDNGILRYLTLNEEGRTDIIRKKWGDYFFGLDFGRPKNTNGGWSLWYFFSCLVNIDGKNRNIPQMYLPENVYIAQVNGLTMAEIISPLSADGKAGKVSMKIMQFPSHNDWLFIRIKFIDSTISPWRLSFSAYPGNSNDPEERERWVATKENDYCISDKGVSFIPKSNALVMYSKYVNDRAGNYIVFDSSKFREIEFPKATTGVSSHFFPVGNDNEFVFAISYFLDKSTADVLPRFLGEDQDIIFRFMENIEWNPKVDGREFNTIMKATERLIKEMNEIGIDGQVYVTELTEIRTGFEKADAVSDMSMVITATSRLKDLRNRISKEGLLKFK